jgi:FAD/FMN-containing dehydrogenase
LPANPSYPWQELSLEGEWEQSDSTLSEYSEDASHHQQRPLAVAFPKSEGDLQQLLQFARTYGLPLTARGAGTSRGGQPLGPGIILEFRRHWQKIIAFDESSRTLKVQPGALYGEVQKYLKELGRSFPPDPSYHQCTIGGMVANNAAGIHSVKYGGTLKHTKDLRYLCGGGQWHQATRADDLHERARAFLAKNGNDLSDYPDVEKNSSGYSLKDAWPSPEAPLDIAKLMVGSEGTLGLATELTLSTVPLPAATALGIVYFPSLVSALEGALAAKLFGPSACELVDRPLLDLHGKNTGQSRPLGPQHAKRMEGNPYLHHFYQSKAEAVLIIETEGDSEAQAQDLLQRILRALGSDFHTAKSSQEMALVWDLRRHSSPILNRLDGGKISIKPLWAVEDVSLPRATFVAYVQEQQKLFQEAGLLCSFFGHAASCNLHIDPVHLDPRLTRTDHEMAALFDRVTRDSYALAIRFGGSISGEHGDGLTRTPFLPLQYPKSYRIFAPLKQIFDPRGILNPGKVVAEEDVLR